MLFTDGDLLTQQDMVALDPEVPEVASAEGLIVEGDGSILRQAWDECANEVLGRMEAFGGRMGMPGQDGQVARVALSQIVATDAYAHKLSALQRWVLYRGMAMFYRAATSRSLNDRHAMKMEQFREDAREQWKALWRRGLPVVHQPLPCPGALHERGAGDWGFESLSSVAGGGDPEATVLVAITWVDGSRYQGPLARGNAESAGSRPVGFEIPMQERLRVAIAGLRPPDGVPSTQTPADGPYRTLVATGWNIYVGLLQGPLYLQNATPIPVADETYTFAAAPVFAGPQLDAGQVPEVNLVWQNVLQRG